MFHLQDYWTISSEGISVFTETRV